MILFFINFRTISNKQIEAATKESISRVQDNVLSMLGVHENLLRASASSVNTLLDAYTDAGAVPRDVMRAYLIDMMKILPDVSFLY
jgi:hypothetical protein